MNFKDFNVWDIGYTKFSVFFATLFLVSFWSEFGNWVMSINWIWFLVLSLGFAIKPLITVFKKK